MKREHASRAREVCYKICREVSGKSSPCETLILLMALCLVSFVSAQDAVPFPDSEASAVPVSEQERSEILREFSDLSRKINENPEISALREKLREAHLAYQTAFDAAAAKENPQLLAKYKALNESRIGRTWNPSLHGNIARAPSGYDALSDEEKKRLGEVRSQAAEKEAVKAARKKRNEAKTEEERSQAEVEYRQALREAIIGADAGIRALIDKMEGKPTGEGSSR